jgi:hypothetical protein
MKHWRHPQSFGTVRNDDVATFDDSYQLRFGSPGPPLAFVNQRLEFPHKRTSHWSVSDLQAFWARKAGFGLYNGSRARFNSFNSDNAVPEAQMQSKSSLPPNVQQRVVRTEPGPG